MLAINTCCCVIRTRLFPQSLVTKCLNIQLQDWIVSFVGGHETGEFLSQLVCFSSDLDNTLLFGIIYTLGRKEVLCGDLPMKEEGEIWTWQVCSLCFEQLTSRSPPGQPLLAHRLFFFFFSLLLFSWELWAGSERVNFSLLSRWLKEPLQTWRCGDNCEVNVFFPFGNSLGKWQQWDFPSTCTFPKVQCFYVRLHYL